MLKFEKKSVAKRLKTDKNKRTAYRRCTGVSQTFDFESHVTGQVISRLRNLRNERHSVNGKAFCAIILIYFAINLAVFDTVESYQADAPEFFCAG